MSCWPETLAFMHACGRPQEAQRQRLRSILTQAQGSEFARRHSLRCDDDFDAYRAKVGLHNYGDFASDLDKICDGEERVLTCSPIRLLEPTSGTHGSKLIPYTVALKHEFQRGICAWVGNLFARRPAILGGPHFWSITPPMGPRQRTRGGLPIGFEDDSGYLSSWAGRLVRSLMAVPGSVLEESDYLGATLRHLVACPQLRMVSVWSPTYWLLLLQRLQRDYGLRPEQAWPKLACLSCWGDGYSERYLEPLMQAHPQVWIQKKGLIATEGLVTIPWVGQPGALLALRSHFYEFLDEGGRSHLAHQLQPGQTYSVVLTTGGGLYRYRLGDQVRVVGYWRDCPSFCFVGRQQELADRFGEKICPSSIRLPQGLAWVAYEPHRRAYTLFARDAASWAGALEADLRASNFHYDLCRRLGQLEAVAAFELGEEALEAFYARLRQLGLREGDFKPIPLRSEEDWSAHLPGRFVKV